MREYRRQVERPKTKLLRGADGRLKSAAEDREIADIWAEGRRVRLAEAIENERIRKANKAKRSQMISNLFLRVKGLKSRKRLVIAGAGSLVLIFSFVGYGLLGSSDGQLDSSAGGVLDAQSTQSPDFETVLPSGKTIDELGGWGRVSPEGSDPVFAFVDNIDGVQLNVSQQALPFKLRSNPDEVRKLAEQFSANRTIDIGGDAAYIGTSDKGPQSVILAKNDLLILIKSSGKLTDQQWKDYIDSLR
jgi:hypothetical protein